MLDGPINVRSRRAKLLGCGISGGIYGAVCCGVPLFFEAEPGSPATVAYGAFLYMTPIAFLWLAWLIARAYDRRHGKVR